MRKMLVANGVVQKEVCGQLYQFVRICSAKNLVDGTKNLFEWHQQILTY